MTIQKWKMRNINNTRAYNKPCDRCGRSIFIPAQSSAEYWKAKGLGNRFCSQGCVEAFVKDMGQKPDTIVFERVDTFSEDGKWYVENATAPWVSHEE